MYNVIKTEKGLVKLWNSKVHFDGDMESQSDLVEVVHTLKQVMCIKG